LGVTLAYTRAWLRSALFPTPPGTSQTPRPYSGGYGTPDGNQSVGQIMVVDEWPEEQSFQSFFEENNERIGALMQAAGVTSEPQPRFWHKLESRDEYGWEG
jgi:hypothetical protein